MPHYNYECIKCGRAMRVFQKMTDDPISTCPFCKGPFERLISGGQGPIGLSETAPPRIEHPPAGGCAHCPEAGSCNIQ